MSSSFIGSWLFTGNCVFPEKINITTAIAMTNTGIIKNINFEPCGISIS
jgi:hypothetical protein